MIHVCKFSHLELGDPVPHYELGQDKFGVGSFQSHVEGCVATVIKVVKLIMRMNTVERTSLIKRHLRNTYRVDSETQRFLWRFDFGWQKVPSMKLILN